MAHIPDTIERELILPVPPARVWTALTRADQLSAWFGTQASVDLRPGGAVNFVWEEASRSAHTNYGIIDVVDPPRRFAFRWQSGPEGRPMTLVDFTLEEHPGGTRLRVVESGFASLPPEQRERNQTGWQRELSDLENYLGKAEPG